MATELASRSELSQLMSNHILCNVNRNKLISVVNGNRMTYEIRRNHRSARPSLDHVLLTAFIHSDDFLLEADFDIRTFL